MNCQYIIEKHSRTTVLFQGVSTLLYNGAIMSCFNSSLNLNIGKSRSLTTFLSLKCKLWETKETS